MDYLVYSDEHGKELQGLLSGKKTMIVRGAARPKLPYAHVQSEDRLFFILSNGLITACSIVKNVHLSEKLTESQSRNLLKANQSKLNLEPEQVQQWTGKRFLVLIEVKDVRLIEPFHFNRTSYGQVDDWLPVERIESVQ